MKFYLRMEAVNLAQFISDCEDLSTIRGGGLLLLESPHRLKTKFPGLQPISLGGSSALFEMEASGLGEASNVCKAAEDFFNADPELRHATFVVDVVPATDNFLIDRETVLAKNRWRQMQSPTVAWPGEAAKLPCRIDMIRPGVAWENDEPMSASVKIRRQYGRNQKQAFYEQQTGLKCPRFVNDFESLSADESQGSLHHKMAVIHLDGNGFGKIQHDLCASPEKQKAFDVTLRKLRRDMLTELLKQTFGKAEWTTALNEHRIETLLWGGDEVVWVVPAWTGLWLLGFFYEHSKAWQFTTADSPAKGLTHAGGLVFCHHNAPIHRITQLAKELTEYSKRICGHAAENVFAYQVLESFDHIGRDVARFIGERRPKDCAPKTALLSGPSLGRLLADARALKPDLPRNKVHAIARALVRNEIPRANNLSSDTLDHLLESTRKQFIDLADHIGGQQMLWVHLAELWDYIPE